jgi:hypothetical protein
MRGFVLVNESSDAAVTKDVVTKMGALLARQQIELADAWQRLPLEVLEADTEASAPTDPGWVLVKLVDTLPDANALAYHTTLADGRPAVLVGVQIVKSNAPEGSNWLTGPDSLLTATSHELCECAVNPYCEDYWPLDSVTWIPKEVCDPVQGDSYELDKGSGLFVSNFVGPRYFSSSAGPYDRMQLVTAPGQLRPGGYQSRSNGNPSSPATNVFGARVEDGGMAEWKRKAKACAGSRASRLSIRRR